MKNANNEITVTRAYEGVYLEELEKVLAYIGEFRKNLKYLDQRLLAERFLENPKIKDSELVKLKSELKDDRMPRILLQILAELTVRYRSSISDMSQVKARWKNSEYYYGFSDDDVEKLAKEWSRDRHHGEGAPPHKGKVLVVEDEDLKLASSSFNSKRAIAGKYIVVGGYKYFDTLTSFKLNTGETVYFATSGEAPFGSIEAGLSVAADQKSREITGFGRDVPTNGPASQDAAKLFRDHKASLIS